MFSVSAAFGVEVQGTPVGWASIMGLIPAPRECLLLKDDHVHGGNLTVALHIHYMISLHFNLLRESIFKTFFFLNFVF